MDIQVQQAQSENGSPRTLRQFGFDSCEHPDGTIAYDRGEPHCGYCGAVKRGDQWVGGSIDYKIDVVVMQVRAETLKKNLQADVN